MYAYGFTTTCFVFCLWTLFRVARVLGRCRRALRIQSALSLTQFFDFPDRFLKRNLKKIAKTADNIVDTLVSDQESFFDYRDGLSLVSK